MKNAVRIAVIVLAAILLTAVLAVYIVLYTPLRNRVLDRITPAFTEGTLRVDKVRLNPFTLLPHVDARLTGVSLTYPHDRFPAAGASDPGRSEAADTLASIGDLHLKAHLFRLLRGHFDIPVLTLEDVRVYEMDYRDGTSNLDIIHGSEKPDTASSKGLPMLDADVEISRTHIYWSRRIRNADLSLKVHAVNSAEDVLDALVRELAVRAGGLDLRMKGEGSDLLGADPKADFDGTLAADAGSVVRLLDASGIQADGPLDLSFNGSIRDLAMKVDARLLSEKLRLVSGPNRYVFMGLDLQTGVLQGGAEEPLRTRPERPAGVQLPDFLSEESFRESDIDIHLGEALVNLVRKWNPAATLTLDKAVVISPKFALKNSIDHLGARISRNEFALDRVDITAGRSSVSLEGSVSGLDRSLFSDTGRGFWDVDLNFKSKRLNVNELLAVIKKAQESPETEDTHLEISDEEYYESLAADELEIPDKLPHFDLIVIPANVIATASMDVGRVDLFDYVIRKFDADLAMSERTFRVSGLKAVSDYGTLTSNAFYQTRTKEDIKAGVDLSLKGVTSENLIRMFPRLDTTMPVLKSILGEVRCEVAAISRLDTNMAPILPSVDGVVRVKGTGLAIENVGAISKLARLLMFRGKDTGYVQDMYIEGLISGNELEVFPFIVTAGNVSVGLSGTHRFDNRFDYRVSLVKSPLLLRLGVKLSGPDFKHMRWRLCRSQFKTVNIPVFHDEVAEMHNSLVTAMYNVFTRDVNQAFIEQRRSRSRLDLKRDVEEYVVEMEDLTLDEQVTVDQISLDLDLEESYEEANEEIDLILDELMSEYW